MASACRPTGMPGPVSSATAQMELERACTDRRLASQTTGAHGAVQRGPFRKPSADRWLVKPNAGGSTKPRPRRSLGDGLPWNWSIWKRHFPDFTPILDFIHVLSYLFVVAKAVHGKRRMPGASTWPGCVAAWRGEVAQVLEELRLAGEAMATPQRSAPSRIRVILCQDDQLPGEQPGSDELSGISPSRDCR